MQGCEYLISENEVKEILSDVDCERYERMNNFIKITEIHEIMVCPHPDCVSLLKISDWITVKCENGHRTCVKCRRLGCRNHCEVNIINLGC